MNKKKREKQLQIVVFVLIAVITLGIGYTAISSIILTITGHARADVDEANFKVHFDRNVEPTMTVNMGSATIDQDNDKVAHISVTGLKKAGDSATAEYTIINESNGIGAKLSIDLVNTNTEHFKVTETLDDVELQAGDTTKVRILVELLETPTDTALETDITGTIEAKAIKNSEANSNDSTSKTKPGTFAGDSWATIAENVRNNDTSAYKVGDTKTVTINGNDYTVRIANKSTPEECNNENFSQTACGFVVEFVDIISKKTMNGNLEEYHGNCGSSNSIGGYAAMDLYSYLNNDLYNSLSADLKNIIINTKTGYNDENNAINYTQGDKLFLLSSIEIYEEAGYTPEYMYTRRLDYYTTSGVESVKAPWGATVEVPKGAAKVTNGVKNWWLRDTIDICHFKQVVNGISNSYFVNAEFGVSPAFRIG